MTDSTVNFSNKTVNYKGEKIKVKYDCDHKESYSIFYVDFNGQIIDAKFLCNRQSKTYIFEGTELPNNHKKIIEFIIDKYGIETSVETSVDVLEIKNIKGRFVCFVQNGVEMYAPIMKSDKGFYFYDTTLNEVFIDTFKKTFNKLVKFKK